MGRSMGDPTSWHPIVNTGALAAFAVFVLYALWRIGSIGGKEVLGLAKRHVENTEVLVATLQDSDRKQKELCEGHRESLVLMAGSVEENTVIQKEQRDHLKKLVELHESPTGAVVKSMGETHSLHRDMGRMKQAFRYHCEMCRVVARNEFPNSAQQVNEHCDKMERLVQDSGPIDVDGLK